MKWVLVAFTIVCLLAMCFLGALSLLKPRDQLEYLSPYVLTDNTQLVDSSGVGMGSRITRMRTLYLKGITVDKTKELLEGKSDRDVYVVVDSGVYADFGRGLSSLSISPAKGSGVPANAAVTVVLCKPLDSKSAWYERLRHWGALPVTSLRFK